MKKLIVMWALLGMVLAGCGGGTGIDLKKFQELSPKGKSAVFWRAYADQYKQYGNDFARWEAMPPGDLRAKLGNSLVLRKKIIAEVKKAIVDYDAWFAAGVADYESVEEWEKARAFGMARLEAKALDLLMQLSGL